MFIVCIIVVSEKIVVKPKRIEFKKYFFRFGINLLCYSITNLLLIKQVKA